MTPEKLLEIIKQETWEIHMKTTQLEAEDTKRQEEIDSRFRELVETLGLPEGTSLDELESVLLGRARGFLVNFGISHRRR